ncbi:MAG: cob(I)yrinic acid a,c-diamide adenosyltransferase [Ignavibacteria bacterium]
MRIYTRTGDNGETGLFGGDRISKSDIRIEAFGTVDELNSLLGLALTDIKDTGIRQVILKIQNQLFTLGTDLATPPNGKTEQYIQRTPGEYIEYIEEEIDWYDSKLEELKNFILPGGSKGAAMLFYARTICRRAERKVVTLNKIVIINQNICVYLNRLSDLCFVLARYENHVNNLPDILWEKT